MSAGIVNVHRESICRESGRNFPSSKTLICYLTAHGLDLLKIQRLPPVPFLAFKPYRLFRVSPGPASFGKIPDFRMDSNYLTFCVIISNNQLIANGNCDANDNLYGYFSS